MDPLAIGVILNTKTHGIGEENIFNVGENHRACLVVQQWHNICIEHLESA